MFQVLIREMLANGTSLIDNPYRLGSERWGAFIAEARQMYDDGEITELDDQTIHLLESMSGELAEYNGEEVMLEVPQQNFDRPGWFFVYVFDGEAVLRLEFEGIVTGSEDVTFD